MEEIILMNVIIIKVRDKKGQCGSVLEENIDESNNEIIIIMLGIRKNNVKILWNI